MTRASFLITVSLAALLVASPQGGPGADAPAKASDVEAQWKQLSSEFHAKKENLQAEREKASKRRKVEIDQEILSLSREYAPRFLACAKSDPGDRCAFDPLLWIVVAVGEGECFDESVALLKEHHAEETNNFNLWMLLPELVYSESDEVDPFLRRILERNPEKVFRGPACFYLAVRMKRQAERDGNGELAKESARLFERAIGEFAQTRCRGGSVGDEAKRELNNLRGPLGMGHVAPDTSGEDLDGVKFKLTDYRGKVVLLSFCGQWCGPCREMYPHEQALVERLAGKPFAFIEVNSDPNKDSHREFMKRRNLTWRCLWEGKQGPVSVAWEVRASPAYFVLDREGVIRFKATGVVDGETLDNWIDSLLNEESK
ncbi:MAG: TlpA family protein disulfide reductase [Pirellulales bacterium]|nr:TlpA family protein disulfide reductase [Pirellulales bacterium]